MRFGDISQLRLCLTSGKTEYAPLKIWSMEELSIRSCRITSEALPESISGPVHLVLSDDKSEAIASAVLDYTVLRGDRISVTINLGYGMQCT